MLHLRAMGALLRQWPAQHLEGHLQQAITKQHLVADRRQIAAHRHHLTDIAALHHQLATHT